MLTDTRVHDRPATIAANSLDVLLNLNEASTAEGKRERLLRGSPHKPKPEVVAAIRGRVAAAFRNAGVRRRVDPRAATDPPDRACRGTDRIVRQQNRWRVEDERA